MRSQRLPVGATVASLLLLTFVLIAVFAPLVAPLDPNKQDLSAPAKVARRRDLGGDLPTRHRRAWTRHTLPDNHGARAAGRRAFISVCVSLVLGTTLGVMAGYFRGWMETVIMRLVDVVLSIPALLLAIIAVIVLEPGLFSLIAVLGFTRWPRYTRVALWPDAGVATRPYVVAAWFHGAGAFWLMPGIYCPTFSIR